MHLYPHLSPSTHTLGFDGTFPQPGVRIFRDQKAPQAIHDALRKFFDSQLGNELYNFDGVNQVIMWKKYHLKFKLSIGTEYSNSTLVQDNRDDSYISWEFTSHRGVKKEAFGRAVLFCRVLDWPEVLCVVREYGKVEWHSRSETDIVRQRLQDTLQVIQMDDIEGLLSRIDRWDSNKRVTHLQQKVRGLQLKELLLLNI
jgi:hypothetical protein